WSLVPGPWCSPPTGDQDTDDRPAISNHGPENQPGTRNQEPGTPMRFKLTLAYDGTEYHGWQVQPNGRSVQGVLEDALSRLGESGRVAAAGRTDAGVHASGQVVSFVLQRQMSPEKLQAALNALTPADMSITAATVVPDDFDPRHNARSRVYRYQMWNAPWPS